MANMTRQPDWDQLVLRSEELVQQDVNYPRVERDIHQIEQFSQRLRAKAARGDPSTEALDASRLLAQEGLNPRKLNQALQTFELRPTYEDVFHAETANVGDYLAHLHEVIAATAIQEVHYSAVSAFEGYMDACMESSWAREKRMLLDSVEPFSAAAVPLPSALMAAAQPGGSLADSGGAMLRGRAASYAQVVRKINASLASGQRYPEAVKDFAAACAQDALSVSDRGTTMLRLWHVLQKQLDGVYAIPASAKSQRESLLISGGKRYLEENFSSHMQQTVQMHRSMAALGGSPSRLGLVQAFLRVREKDRAPLDFDQPGGANTCWIRIYTCLRAGFLSEAVSIAKATSSSIPQEGAGATTPRAAAAAAASSTPRDLAAMLQEWIEGGCVPLSGPSGSAALAECERLLRDKVARGRDHHIAHRMAIYALLSGSNRSIDAITREFSYLFSTIEDFMWIKLGVVRLNASSTQPGLEIFTLADLQKYLSQYPSAHFSHGGKEPLLYAIVLLLSLQAAAAVSFLARDPSSKDYRLDAVHLGACLWHAHVLPTTPHTSVRSGVGSGSNASAGQLLHQYGASLLHGDAALALEYYMLSAAAQGGSLAIRGELLRELLTESHAYGMLLGAGGVGGEHGALAAFIPNTEERKNVLEAVAAECAAAAQLEEAVELFMVAGRPGRALFILNHCLSDVLETALSDPAKREEAEALIARAGAAVASIGPSMDASDIKEVDAFEQLKSIRSLLTSASTGDYSQALLALNDLVFVPIERYRLQLCVGNAPLLHPAVADRLQAVVLAGAEALAGAGKWTELQTVVAFAASVPNRISQTAYQRLNQLQAASAT